MTFTPAQWAIIMAAHDNRERIALQTPAWMLPKVTETPITPHGNMNEHEQEAYDLGAEHARNAASWVIDNRSTHPTHPTHYANVLTMLDDGDPAVYDYLPNEPNLSGEWADDLTPLSLYEAITGRDHADSEEEAGMAYETLVGSIMDALCGAYEQGVSDTFMIECECILRAAVA